MQLGETEGTAVFLMNSFLPRHSDCKENDCCKHAILRCVAAAHPTVYWRWRLDVRWPTSKVCITPNLQPANETLVMDILWVTMHCMCNCYIPQPCPSWRKPTTAKFKYSLTNEVSHSCWSPDYLCWAVCVGTHTSVCQLRDMWCSRQRKIGQN